MRTVDSRWVDVEPNNFVQDKDGKWWKVLAWDHVQATLVDKDGTVVKARPNAYAEVTRMHQTMNDAVSLVENILGVVVIEERNTK